MLWKLSSFIESCYSLDMACKEVLHQPLADPVWIRVALEYPVLVWLSRRIIAQRRGDIIIKDLPGVVVYRDGAEAKCGGDGTSAQCDARCMLF